MASEWMRSVAYRVTHTQWSRFRPLLGELVKRDLKVKYRRSLLGYLWSLLNPLLMMLTMTVVFSYMFRFDIPNFPLYLICGQTLWTFFSDSTNMAMDSILNNGSLIKKVYVPKYIFPISRVLSSFVTMLFSLVAILLVMIFTGTAFHWQVMLFFVPVAFLFVFCCGIGMILAGLAVRFRDVRYLYSVLSLAWMYCTPIFYPINAVPAAVQTVIKLNPMYHYINFFRALVLYGAVPGVNTWLACSLSSVLMFVIGFAIFQKMQREFILYL